MMVYGLEVNHLKCQGGHLVDGVLAKDLDLLPRVLRSTLIPTPSLTRRVSGWVGILPED